MKCDDARQSWTLALAAAAASIADTYVNNLRTNGRIRIKLKLKLKLKMGVWDSNQRGPICRRRRFDSLVSGLLLEKSESRGCSNNFRRRFSLNEEENRVGVILARTFTSQSRVLKVERNALCPQWQSAAIGAPIAIATVT